LLLSDHRSRAHRIDAPKSPGQSLG